MTRKITSTPFARKLKIFSSAVVILASSLFCFQYVYACSVEKQNLNAQGSRIMNFKFEDYEKGEDAQKRLLELYPIGSDYEVLASSLKSINRMSCARAKTVSSLECEYLISTSRFSSISWSISIFENGGRITNIETYRTLSYI
jgi:hypothetical protein